MQQFDHFLLWEIVQNWVPDSRDQDRIFSVGRGRMVGKSAHNGPSQFKADSHRSMQALSYIIH